LKDQLLNNLHLHSAHCAKISSPFDMKVSEPLTSAEVLARARRKREALSNRQPCQVQEALAAPSKLKPKKNVLGSVVSVGDVGYKFRKEFQAVWTVGTVVENYSLRSQGGKICRCVYADGRSENLSLGVLIRLQFLDPNVSKYDPAQITPRKEKRTTCRPTAPSRLTTQTQRSCNTSQLCQV
jgi:hypothetical protein